MVGPEHPFVALVREALVDGEAVGPRSVPLEIQERHVVYSLTAQMFERDDDVYGVLVSARDMEQLSQARLASFLLPKALRSWDG